MIPNPFKGPAGFMRVFNIMMGAVFGVVLNVILMPVLGLPLTPATLLQASLLCFFIGYFIGDVVPAMPLGQALAAKLHAKGIVAHLVSSVVVAFCMGTGILFFMATINFVATEGIEGAAAFFLMAYPYILACAYASIVIFVPLGKKISAAISGFDPNKAPKE